MILAVDVGYQENTALAIGVVFDNWQSPTPKKIYQKQIDNIASYQSGNFYQRELPCILALLADVSEKIDVIVIDGYVRLGEQQSAGLGQHLWQTLPTKIPIIGVAKSYFQGTPSDCQIFRGNSKKALFITSIDIPLIEAKQTILSMFGEHRIPYLLKLADQHSKKFS